MTGFREISLKSDGDKYFVTEFRCQDHWSVVINIQNRSWVSDVNQIFWLFVVLAGYSIQLVLVDVPEIRSLSEIQSR